jgi:hypothetical protein
MFHHAVMDADDQRDTGALLGLLASHRAVRCTQMWTLTSLRSELRVTSYEF